MARFDVGDMRAEPVMETHERCPVSLMSTRSIGKVLVVAGELAFNGVGFLPFRPVLDSPPLGTDAKPAQQFGSRLPAGGAELKFAAAVLGVGLGGAVEVQGGERFAASDRILARLRSRRRG